MLWKVLTACHFLVDEPGQEPTTAGQFCYCIRCKLGSYLLDQQTAEAMTDEDDRTASSLLEISMIQIPQWLTYTIIRSKGHDLL